MIRLEDILPGDVIVSLRGALGTVVEARELSADRMRSSHLFGGKNVWARWSDDEGSGPLYANLDYIKEHRPQGKDYDPKQQPYEEDDI